MKKIALAAIWTLAGFANAYAANPGHEPLADALQTGRFVVRPTAQTSEAAIQQALQALDKCSRMAAFSEFGDACGDSDARTRRCSAYFQLYFAWLGQAVSSSRKAVGILGKLTVTDLALARPAYDQLNEKIGDDSDRDYKLTDDEAKRLTPIEEKQYVAMRVELADLGDTLKRTFKLVDNQ